ncbi:MAG: hypothetical protein MUF38_05790 [Anaerolineae bacterium]|jgi:hypothetical protein|nr:hypothetical protein [Anaerolineae bacterium]
MADIVRTKENVALLQVHQVEVYSLVAGEYIEAGQLVCINSSGKVVKADAGALATARAAGFATANANINEGVSVLRRGMLEGFTLTSLAYNALVYVSDTAGAVADAPGASGTYRKVVGSVWAKSDPTKTKVLMVDIDIVEPVVVS